MEKMNEKGNIIARCPDCNGRESTFEFREMSNPFGAFMESFQYSSGSSTSTKYKHYRLFRCAGCGRGAVAKIISNRPFNEYPASYDKLEWFVLESHEKIKLPDNTPSEIASEFREAENCLEAKCYRAAAAMFRSTLEKVFELNGYKISSLTNLKARIDAAAKDGVITSSRQKRAHDEIRVLGNDVLHEPWKEFTEEDVKLSHQYTQRIIEDFYDERVSVETILTNA
jgi:hypothetical protein